MPFLRIAFAVLSSRTYFGAELVFAICEGKGVEVIILNKGEDTGFVEDLAKDVPTIITVFSARL